MSSSLKFIKIFPGEQELGLEQLKKCIKYGKYSQVEGESSLLRIWVNEKKYDQAVKLADSLISRYPGYLYCYRYKTRALIELGKYKEALETQEKLLEQIKANEYSLKYTELEVEVELLKIYILLEQRELARKFGNDLLKKYKYFRIDRVVEKVREIEDIVEEL